ncbi:uncharacterized protein SPAPADRAFT_60773 [Spathaspora passalidarum NRRL Y-27907]|uniref:Uncharacterized protein n=1 Tax=Spathaspora passalidarum (strain NRRL Y-27907 / 11-Y1) TaxID=619300 RepID=G3AMB8_SPAPN|nr:uncharacterized protein SPAPADRAFT_60773 [Spathaspora passalidarum NRRL Y-27907]EGW33416.1 hypothetical protein SPAPADRAFT_60773 [Spathaspora passalidarum NRRL Y-27907]
MVLGTPVPANIKLKATLTSQGTQSTKTFSVILPTYTPRAPIVVKKKDMDPILISFNNKQEILDAQNIMKETKWVHGHKVNHKSHANEGL